MKFKIEKYTKPVQQRSWLAHYENNNHPSAYWTEYVDRWRVLLNGKVVDDNLFSEERAKYYVNNWKKSEKDINKIYEEIIDEIDKQAQKKVEMAAKWRDKQLKRLEALEKGRLPESLKDLSEYLPEV